MYVVFLGFCLCVGVGAEAAGMDSFLPAESAGGLGSGTGDASGSGIPYSLFYAQPHLHAFSGTDLVAQLLLSLKPSAEIIQHLRNVFKEETFRKL